MNNQGIVVTRENIEYLLQFCTLDECWQLQKVFQKTRLEKNGLPYYVVEPGMVFKRNDKQIQNRLNVYVKRPKPKKEKVSFSWLPTWSDCKEALKKFRVTMFHVKQWATVL